MVIEGTYKAMEANHMLIHPADVTVQILPPVYTDHLTPEEGKKIGDIVREQVVQAKNRLQTV